MKTLLQLLGVVVLCGEARAAKLLGVSRFCTVFAEVGGERVSGDAHTGEPGIVPLLVIGAHRLASNRVAAVQFLHRDFKPVQASSSLPWSSQ